MVDRYRPQILPGLSHFVSDKTWLDAGDAAAAVIVVDGRYLMQLRDDRPGIYYPGHWGLFGGAVEPGETPLDALRRELMEEIALSDFEPVYFTRFDFDLTEIGQPRIFRVVYTIGLEEDCIPKLKLGEGADMRVFEAGDLLAYEKVVPYDAFSVWLHANRGRLDPRIRG